MALAKTARAAIPVFFGLFGFFTPFSIAGSHISLAIACALVLFEPESRAQTFALLRRHPLTIPIFVWVAVHLLAVMFAVHPIESLEKLKKLALLALLPIGALPIVRDRLRPLLAVLIGSTVVVAIWGLTVHLLAGGGLEARVRGISGFYMTVAGIFMTIALLSLAELLSALKDPHSRRIAFLSGALIANLTGLLGTYTRGSWIGFFAGALLLLRRHRVAILSAALVAVLFFALGPGDARDRVLSNLDPKHPRNVERVLIWKHGLELARESPLTGLGLVIPKEKMHREVLSEHGLIRVHSHMHNAYLQIVVSMGFPALAVFGWFVVALFQTGRRAARAEIRNLWEDGLVRAYPAVLGALLANGLFEWNFGDSEVLGLLYFLTGCVLGVEAGSEA